MKKEYKCFALTGVLLLLFVVFTVVVMKVDVRPIGPLGSSVGLAAINQFIFEGFGVSLTWYKLTDWLGLVIVPVVLGFALLGIMQLVKRRSIFKVDRDIILLGIFYLLAAAVYVLFENKIVNYRPILMDNKLEASFPSSHTMIVLFIMATAVIQFHRRIKNRLIRNLAETVSILIVVITIIGRLLSGVHWFTDILGGLLSGAVLIMLYWSGAERL